jgi:hypothetical protein
MKREDIAKYEKAADQSDAAGSDKTPVNNKHLRHLLLTERLARARFDELSARTRKQETAHDARND